MQEENDELSSSQRSSSSSSATTAKPSTLFDSGSGIRPVPSNSDQPISLDITATDHASDLVNYNQLSNSSLINLNQNCNSKPPSSDQVILIDSSHPAVLHRSTFKPLLTVPHPTVPPPPPPFSLLKSPLPPPLPHSKKIWNDTPPLPLPLPSIGTQLAAATTTRHLTFDIPGGIFD